MGASTGADERVLLVELHAAAGRHDELLASLLELAEATRREAGCLMYELYRDEADAGTFFICERWASSDALEDHNSSIHVDRFVESAPGMTDRPVRVVALAVPLPTRSTSTAEVRA